MLNYWRERPSPAIADRFELACPDSFEVLIALNWHIKAFVSKSILVGSSWCNQLWIF